MGRLISYYSTGTHTPTLYGGRCEVTLVCDGCTVSTTHVLQSPCDYVWKCIFEGLVSGETFLVSLYLEKVIRAKELHIQLKPLQGGFKNVVHKPSSFTFKGSQTAEISSLNTLDTV